MTTNEFAGYYSGLVGGEDDQIALVGYSSPAILIGFILSLILIMIPLLLSLRKIQGSMIISRSNSLIMSAACHVSILREVYSPSSKSMSMARDDKALNHSAEATGSAEDWGQRTVADMAAAVEEGIELQPLISGSREHSAASHRNTTQLEQASREVPAENITNIEKESTSKSVDLERDNRGALRHGRDAEERPLLSSLSNRESVIIVESDIGQDGNANRTISAGRTFVSDEDVYAESPRPVTFTHAKGDHSRSTVSYLDTADDDDRIQAACRLEDGSDSEEDDAQFRINISRSRIRWGVVRMPEEFYAQFEDLEGGAKLDHLSFGIEQQAVTAPEPGHFYA